MSISMRAGRRRAALVVIGIIAASCALPSYEVGPSSSSASSSSASSGGGSDVSTAASTGGGTSQGGQGGQGGHNTGGEGGGENVDCVKEALDGQPCAMDGAKCEVKEQGDCVFLATCKEQKWLIQDSSLCPPEDLTLLKGAQCTCDSGTKFCKVPKHCADAGKTGQVAFCNEVQQWEVFSSPAVCCGDADVCHPKTEVCVETTAQPGGTPKFECKDNVCAAQQMPLICPGCANELCPGCLCMVDPNNTPNHVKCTSCL